MAEASKAHRERDTIALVFDSVQALAAIDDCGLYWVDQEGNAFGHAARNLSAEAVSRYRREIAADDPLHPRHFCGRGEQAVDLRDGRIPSARRERYVRSFLAPCGLLHELDLFLYDDHRLIACIGLMRAAAAGPFNNEEAARLQAIAPLIAALLGKVKFEATVNFALTGRESDVAKLVREGRSNNEIAGILGIGRSTVKTHMEHLFSKTGAVSRTQLVWLLGSSSSALPN